MIELQDLVWLFALLLAAWYGWRALRVQEDTLRKVKRYCRHNGVQLLDGSIALRRVSLCRVAGAGLGLRRIYGFEFTATGADRYEGIAQVAGNRLEAIQLAPHRIQ